MIAIKPADSDRESGMSLVELLVYSVLSIVVLTLVGSVLTAALRSEQQVRSLSEATSLGQLVSRSVEEGIRNASSIDPPNESDVNGELLRARVAIGASAGAVKWECQAWYFAPSTGSFYSARDDSGAIAAPTSLNDLKSSPWTFLGKGIHRADGESAFFGWVGETAGNSGRVVLRFKVSSKGTDLVLIPNTVVRRLPATGGTGPATCF
ncbi:hypothetical protein [Mycetocola sp. 2940]|uniref:PilW family protein n=1 Tax=Mycetocola sp. 2940 TaxID=3156452 RepID=UPI00339B5943